MEGPREVGGDTSTFVPARLSAAFVDMMLAGFAAAVTNPAVPHRMPEVPMFGATDAEFGYPPRRPERPERRP